MNKKVKFHKHSSPAFNAGEVWSSGRVNIEIISVEPLSMCGSKFDYKVTYWNSLEKIQISSKDIGIFQERYQHLSDFVAQGK